MSTSAYSTVKHLSELFLQRLFMLWKYPPSVQHTAFLWSSQQVSTAPFKHMLSLIMPLKSLLEAQKQTLACVQFANGLLKPAVYLTQP